MVSVRRPVTSAVIAPRSRKSGRSRRNATAIPVPKIARKITVPRVSCQFSQKRTPSATTAVKRPPTSWMRPVPTRFLMPSGSVMTRDTSMPLFVLSKKRTGRRTRCAWTSSRRFDMARCAATLTTCDSANEVMALMSVATPAAMASGVNSSTRCLPITSSISHFVLAGRTKPAARLMSMRTSPIETERRCSQMSARASAQARFESYFGLRVSAMPKSIELAAPSRRRTPSTMPATASDRPRCS